MALPCARQALNRGWYESVRSVLFNYDVALVFLTDSIIPSSLIKWKRAPINVLRVAEGKQTFVTLLVPISGLGSITHRFPGQSSSVRMCSKFSELSGGDHRLLRVTCKTPLLAACTMIVHEKYRFLTIIQIDLAPQQTPSGRSMS